MSAAVEKHLSKIRKDRNLSCFDLCSIDDLTDADIKLIFDLAKAFKEAGNVKYSHLKGATIFNAFFENSTRTRASFEIGGKKLGADTINITSGGTSVKKGETLHDTAQTLNAMRSEVIIVRSEYSGIPYFLSKHVSAAVINAGDGMHEHPTQGLIDGFTMVEHYGNIKGKTVLVVGDISHSRVAGSLIRIAPKLGAKVRVAAPRTFIRNGFEEAFSYIKVYHNIEKALQGTDIVVTLRVQEERGGGKGLPTLREFSKAFGISEARFAMANEGAILMDPGPVLRDILVHNALMTHSATKILDQVENGVAIRSALLWLFANRTDKKTKPYTRV